MGVWLFYIQHQFEETFWAHDGEWNFHEASLRGSSYYDLPSRSSAFARDLASTIRTSAGAMSLSTLASAFSKASGWMALQIDRVEILLVSARAAQVSGAQDQKRSNDQVATGVAIVVFWPAAFLVGGDGPMAAELAQLKGQMVAIEQASIQKKCGIKFQREGDAPG